MSLRKFFAKIFGDPNERLLDEMQPLVDQINDLEAEYEALTDKELRAKTATLLDRVQAGETLEDVLVEAFAAVREASKRTTGMRHYDVQLLGGIALHRGYAVEMKTGEGKTLVATLPLYLNALHKKGAHLVTVNDYLARRDVQWMGPVYHLLGLDVGLLQQGKDQSFVFDPEHKRPGDDYDQLRPVSRKESYLAHITYGTNSEFGFDYLRDNSTYRLENRVQRGFFYAIVDEVDSILIDEARTPLIISGPASEPTDEYYTLAEAVRQLHPEDYEIDEKSRSITLTDAGYDRVEQLLGVSLFNPDYPEEVSPQQTKLIHHLEQALKAEYIFRRDRDYILQGKRVVIVDEFTGRTMPGRRWSDGLHQAVEAKESVPIRQENITYATITLQNYFRMYEKLAGMTGTAATEAEEFAKIYELEVMVLPTNRPVIREDHSDVILRTKEGKVRAIAQEIVSMHCNGRPTLVGTASVENSEYLSGRLDAGMLRKLAGVLLLRDVLNSSDVDATTYKESMRALNQPLESISASDLRKLGNQLDISISPKKNLDRLAELFEVTDPAQLQQVLNSGVPHQVLNARYHTQEARIVAKAGDIGVVTIATNMAGRGVDIKLGGELDEETVSLVNRVLEQNEVPPYDLSPEAKAEALQALDPEHYYLYQDAVNAFIKHVQNEEKVKALGGLHVLGTERHEARRIDNQLRGRSGRQGDPGSSRFYLSLEDDLMRRFGGSRVANLVERLGAEDDMPIAMGIVSRVVANAQTQVEGHNFDIRKHLIEYDDVLNTQREVIYEQRKRILSKPDLRDDMWQMIKAEIKQRIDAIFAQVERGEKPDLHRLVFYLEQMQPTATASGEIVFPSFVLKYVTSTLPESDDPQQMRRALQETIQEALEIEQEYVYQMVVKTVDRALAQGEQVIDRLMEHAAIAYEGAEFEARETGQPLEARAAVNAVSEQTGLDLDAQPLRDLQGRDLERAVMDQVRQAAQIQNRMRLIAQVAQRVTLREFQVPGALITKADDQELVSSLLNVIEQMLDQTTKLKLADIEQDIQRRIRRPEDCTTKQLTRFLRDVRFGTHTGFDKKHRKVNQSVERFRFTAWVAEQIAGWERKQLQESILGHLRAAIDAWAAAWGRAEFQRIGPRQIAELDEETRAGLMRALGKEQFDELADVTVADLADQDARAVQAYLGERVLFNVQRQLMLAITDRFWVEYLTSIEVLRQGIGLQSYAQKDPLAEYKVRAYEMFQELLQNIQTQVVTEMFTYRPRNLDQVRVGVDRKKREGEEATPSSSNQSQRKRRKRRKRRR